MLRPRPVPSPTSRVVKNGSKMRERFAASMPVAGIRHVQLHRARGVVEACADRQPPYRLSPHGLFGVEDEVQQRLLNLPAIGNHACSPGWKWVMSSTPVRRSS